MIYKLKFYQPQLICLHTVKQFQVLLSNTNNSNQNYPLIGTLLNSLKYWIVFKYCMTLIILFNIILSVKRSKTFHSYGP